ncbi:MAG: hypothetical protein U0L20_05390 [Ruminococcus sp.]|nr:hypothetical protein [Ruminococcus sp.]
MLNKALVNGYSKKTKKELLLAIDECKTISQLYALIQHEQITIQMHAQSGASNITPKKLTQKETIKQKDTPLDRLKAEVRKAVESKTKAEILLAIDECKTISQLFALIQHEKITIQMHAQSGASNIRPKKLATDESLSKKDTPLERLKSEVRKAVESKPF